MALLLPALLGFLLTFSGHLIALRLFPQLHLLDRPERYGLARRPLPYPTGIVSGGTFLLIFLLTSSLSAQAWGLAAGLGLLLTVSLLDDRRSIPPLPRLIIQLLIGLLLFATGTRIYTLTHPFGGYLKLDTIDIPTSLFGPLPLWSGVFTVGWIVLTTNAFNWFDGIPGQVNILTTIGGLTLGFLALSSRVQQPEIAAVAFLLSACALGGLLFDFPPNRVVLGDTGAMGFGLILGALTIYAGGKVATAFLVLGLPLIDAVLVLARRFLKGESLFSGNQDHLHHRLLRKGWSERQVILLTVVLGGSFGVTALFLSTLEKFLAAGILTLIVLGLTWYSRERKQRI